MFLTKACVQNSFRIASYARSSVFTHAGLGSNVLNFQPTQSHSVTTLALNRNKIIHETHGNSPHNASKQTNATNQQTIELVDDGAAPQGIWFLAPKVYGRNNSRKLFSQPMS